MASKARTVKGDQRIVDLLLKYGADPRARHLPKALPRHLSPVNLDKGYMASKHAHDRKNTELCKILRKEEISLQVLCRQALKKDPSFKVNTENGMTFFQGKELMVAEKNVLNNHFPLMGIYLPKELEAAVRKCDEKAVRELLESGVVYNDQICYTQDNKTLFFIACETGSLAIVKLLAECGASFTLHCQSAEEQWLSTIDVAKEKGHTKIVEFIESVRARQIEIFKAFMLEQVNSPEENEHQHQGNAP